jgi:hypothetical protein
MRTETCGHLLSTASFFAACCHHALIIVAQRSAGEVCARARARLRQQQHVSSPTPKNNLFRPIRRDKTHLKGQECSVEVGGHVLQVASYLLLIHKAYAPPPAWALQQSECQGGCSRKQGRVGRRRAGRRRAGRPRAGCVWMHGGPCIMQSDGSDGPTSHAAITATHLAARRVAAGTRPRVPSTAMPCCLPNAKSMFRSDSYSSSANSSSGNSCSADGEGDGGACTPSAAAPGASEASGADSPAGMAESPAADAAPSDDAAAANCNASLFEFGSKSTLSGCKSVAIACASMPAWRGGD